MNLRADLLLLGALLPVVAQSGSYIGLVAAAAHGANLLGVTAGSAGGFNGIGDVAVISGSRDALGLDHCSTGGAASILQAIGTAGSLSDRYPVQSAGMTGGRDAGAAYRLAAYIAHIEHYALLGTGSRNAHLGMSAAMLAGGGNSLAPGFAAAAAGIYLGAGSATGGFYGNLAAVVIVAQGRSLTVLPLLVADIALAESVAALGAGRIYLGLGNVGVAAHQLCSLIVLVAVSAESAGVQGIAGGGVGGGYHLILVHMVAWQLIREVVTINPIVISCSLMHFTFFHRNIFGNVIPQGKAGAPQFNNQNSFPFSVQYRNSGLPGHS